MTRVSWKERGGLKKSEKLKRKEESWLSRPEAETEGKSKAAGS